MGAWEANYGQRQSNLQEEETEYHRMNSRTATMVSPSFPFPGPPPASSLYNHSPAANSHHIPGPSGLISPAESRRMSGDEPPSIQTTRQSLPSISEALGAAESALPYPPPPPQAPQQSSSYFPPPASTSVSELHRRSVTTGPSHPEPHHSYSHPHPQSPFMNRAPPAVQAPHTPTTQSDLYARPALYAPLGPTHAKLPTLQPIKTDTSPTTSTFGRPGAAYSSSQPSPAYETPPHTAGQYPPYLNGNSHQYAQPHPGPANAGPLYPASAALSTPPAYVHVSTRNQYDNGYRDDQPQGPSRPSDAYTSTVKRHLDEFEIEASLNEVAECSGKLGEFAQEYGYSGSRAHNSQRGEMSSRSLPRVQMIDELLMKWKRADESLKRIRDVVVAHDKAMDMERQDVGRNGEHGYNYSNDLHNEAKLYENGDHKKRRGRAAPPGRCHSCNRAETPEWRRGPDGARTLCNACGLHYAKLTRKMGNKASIGSSNLRPKENA